MSKGMRYATEFKQEVVNQVIIHGYSVNDVSERLGISSKTLHAWTKTLSKPPKQRQQERDILKKAAVFFAIESNNVTRS